MSAVLVGYLLYRVDLGAVAALLGTVGPAVPLAGVLLILTELYVKAWRWKVFLGGHRLRIRDLDVASSFLAASFLANLTPGHVGEAARPYFLKRRYRVSFFKLLPIVVVERFLDFSVLLVFAAAFLLFYSFYASDMLRLVLVVVFALLGVVLTILVRKTLALRCADLLLGKCPLAFFRKLRPKAVKVMGDFYAGVKCLRSARLAQGAVLTLVAWLLDAGILFLVASALAPGSVTFFHCLGFLSFAMLGGIVSTLPGGLGSFEAIMFGFFALAGLPEPAALSVTLLYRFLSFGIGVSVGGLFFYREVRA